MKRKIRNILILLLMLIPAAALAGTVQLPRTGQTGCWDTNGNAIDCAGTGQDGEKRAGVAWPEPRFTDNGDQTMTDNLTGLIWTKDGNAPGPAACSPGTSKTWQGALDLVACLNSNNYLNHSDWRLPNRKEMKSLVNRQQPEMAFWLYGQGFDNVLNSYYWSSSNLTYGSFSGLFPQTVGNIGVVGDFSSKDDYYYVWPVRGGQSGAVQLPQTGQTASYAAGDDGALQKGAAWPSPRWTNNGNGTVTDNLTGLIWLQNTNCTDTSGGISKANGDLTWANALTWSNNLASGACGLTDGSAAGDWRLPNIEELESLVDLANSYPSLPAGHPFNNVQSDFYYWSSSTVAYYTDSAWFLYMKGGSVVGYNKASSNYVWPVRGGQSGSFYASFTDAGVWKYRGTGTDWDQVTSSNPELLVTVGSTLYGTFSGLGIWRFNGTEWDQTTSSVPQMIVGTSTTLYGAFSGWGIWQWNGTQWDQTTSSNPQKIVAATTDLYGTFAGLGIWKWNGTTWEQVTTSVPDMLVTSGVKLYGAFAGLGIWLWNGTQWAQATASSPAMIAANSTTLYGAFTGAGIWSWSGSDWTQISTENPTQMSASGSDLYAAFTGLGVRKWNGASWNQITSSDPVRMVVGE